MKLGWESDYKERNRVMELFNVKRGYRELAERIKIERISNIKYLPYEVNSVVVNDDYINIDDNIHLPVVRSSVLAVSYTHLDVYKRQIIKRYLKMAYQKVIE